ncbi:MAG TPA: phosphate ABC transporter permease [Crinalium sp.]|jgi:hypothetical protein
MLIPLTRAKFEELIPAVATGDQYKYYWGKPADFLKRLLISITGLVAVFILKSLLPDGFSLLEFIVGVVISLYWLWAPVYQASRRNLGCRKYQYSGFWQGRVLDVFVTEELIGKEETVNNKGELVIVENRERRLNLEIGDETGFETKIQVPLKRDHRVIRRGDIAEMVVMSNRPDLSRFTKISDVYLSDYDLWVSDYPLLRRDSFIYVSRRLNRDIAR